jgi:hypothetical protein
LFAKPRLISFQKVQSSIRQRKKTHGMNTPGFSLRKWYLDCVAENGDTLIGYSAALRWNLLNLHYSSTIRIDGDSPVRTRTSLERNHSPQPADNKIIWSSPALKLEGIWTALEKSTEKLLYESDEGKVIWSCLQPRSEAIIRIGEKDQLMGLGYVEFLDLTIKPWHLPISELRWGRFLSNSESIIWIDWHGSHPLTLVIHNGKEIQASVTDEQVALNDGRVLKFSNQKELRSGTLVSTVLASIPGMDKVVPSPILHAHETKWRSRGQLSSAGKEAVTGWAIHEVVKFNETLV